MTKTLPGPQQRMFEKLGREFDNSQYNKALRSADSILAVFHDHADTLAMKGLTLHKLEKPEEAFEYIKKAIKLDPKSTTAWHCLGSCQVFEKKYPEALKAFKQALTTDPQNYTILRDISSIAVQVRDWEQFLEARQKIVVQRPSVRANWVALSCAHKMLGNPKIASMILETMPQMLDEPDPIENSELIMYRVELALEQGDPSAALDLLKKFEGRIKDEVSKLFIRAQVHTALGQKIDAEHKYKSLIQMGISEGDCIAKIARLRKIQLDEHLRPKSNSEQYMALLDSIIEEFPRCDYARRHALDCAPIESFRERLSTFAAGYIRRMVPSLWSVLKSLYRFPDRAAIIGEVFTEWEEQLVNGTCTVFDETNPCYILWVWTFLATHWRRVGDYEKAHHYIDKAIEHTPTLELLYLEKSKIYSREGNTNEAAKLADKARAMDLQDKYLNSKAAKMFFRDNNIEKGEELMSLFYRPGTIPEEIFLIALESQCYWYEKEVGEAFYRKGDIVAALQNLLMFELHHSHNHNELYDFHNYVFRRGTMRYWFDVINRDDNPGENKFFLKMCPCIVRCYMRIHEEGEEAIRAAHKPRPLPDITNLSPEDAKRISQQREDYYLEDIDLSEPLKKAEKYLNHFSKTEFYTVLEKPLLVARSLLALKKQNYALLNDEVRKFEGGLYKQLGSLLDGRVKDIIEEILRSAHTLQRKPASGLLIIQSNDEVFEPNSVSYD
eukprot:gene5042-3631_t